MATNSLLTFSHHNLLQQLKLGDLRVLARAISLIENEIEGYIGFLEQLDDRGEIKITGITGPPGAGKSTITDQLIGKMIMQGRKVGVLCVDPSSPFHFGALLGDRIRMHAWYNNPNVFIRSLATRGALGGLHPKIIEICDLLKTAGYTDILVETVGVGQSEIEIAGLADTTVVVLMPEAGDDIQTMKSGLMEVADIFVVNKSDRPDAGRLVTALEHISMAEKKPDKPIVPVFKTVATTGEGVDALMAAIGQHVKETDTPANRSRLYAARAWQLIMYQRMKSIEKKFLAEKIMQVMEKENFNLYRFVAAWQ